MSSALEPPTTAKVILHTTKGPIEIELWAKETPKASRNFLQLCLDGYYDNTIFHRIIPDFLIQGGDPTGTGHGGQSIYTDEEGGFPSEFHSRLRFNRRGLLGNAESEAMNDNSQFFITLAATPELQRKNTMFGRIMGDTIFNVLKIGEAERDSDDRPLYPAKITHTEILVNYFPDMKPRKTSQQKSTAVQQQKKNKKAATAKAKVKMSFGVEGEEDEDDAGGIAKHSKSRFKMKSAHEILNDSRLSKEVLTGSAVPETPPQSTARSLEVADSVPLSVKEKPEKDKPMQEQNLSEQPKKLSVGLDEENEDQSGSRDQVTKVESEFDKINAEIAAMKSSLKRRADDNNGKESHKKVSAVEEQRLKYLSKKDPGVSKKHQREQREAATLAMLRKFKSKLHAASSSVPLSVLKVGRTKQDLDFEDDGEKLCDLHNLPNCQSCLYYDNLSDGEDDSASIWSHSFVDEKSQRRKPQRIFSPPLEPKFQHGSQSKDRRDRSGHRHK
ncbi:cyclophilin-like domain-containing protein [Lipomyces kononenkoae]|uniref:Cyclophilin-like domain-containing protein n=1 Tax=Lipomyces kononenkoae TaxID=34357 RepID=A0ACC3T6D3_LIPKO